jgi:hypothetical protein
MKKIFITTTITIVAIIVVGWLLILYAKYGKTTFTLSASTVKPGGSVTVSYTHIGDKDYPLCLIENPTRSVRDSSGNEMLVSFSDVTENVNSSVGIGQPNKDRINVLLTQGSGFIERGFYQQLQTQSEYIVEPIGSCLPGTSGGFWHGLIKKKLTGVADELIVLPGTPAGNYTLDLNGQNVNLSVTQ